MKRKRQRLTYYRATLSLSGTVANVNGQLSHTQRGDFFKQALDVLEYEPADRVNPRDAVAQIVEDWLPAVNDEIRTEWETAGCPEPLNLCNAKTLHGAMLDALRELFTTSLYEAIETATTYGQAVTLLHADRATYGH